MNVKSVLPFFVGLALMLHAPAASAQYTPRPGSPQGGNQAEGAGSGLGLAVVTHLSGESLLRSADDEDWAALSLNYSLRIGDRVWTQDGAKIEIRFPAGATSWVNFQSELDITRMEKSSRVDTIQLALVSGEAAFDVKGFSRPGSVFQVDIPNASIRASRAARFRVNTLPDGTAQIGVISGSLVLETPDGFTEVSGGRMAEIQPDRSVVLDLLPVSDEWDEWVRSRVQIYDRPAASRRYLPAELSPYAHEFDTSGRWVTDRTYGSVWVPAVERDWSPYSNGRWVWQANDYVWLPFDPWYAPFHFGRWSWSVSVGWFWIVPRGRAYWSPGYVGWSVAGDEVSWVPLGHNEVYYGYGNYGPGNVNVFNTTIINITRIYINSRVNNGVVVVRRDNFLRGKIRHDRIVPPRNPFEVVGGVVGGTIIGRPPVHEIKPIPETRQPQLAGENKRPSPPPSRLDTVSTTIRERIVAPTPKKSAFRKGSAPPVLQNILREKQLEKAAPATRAPAPNPGGATSPAERQKRVGVPARPAAPAVHDRQPQQQPAGKRQFKRIPEPQGGAKGEKEKQSSEEKHKKAGEQGGGNKK